MPIHLPASFWENSWAYQRSVQDELRGSILAAGLGKRMEPLTVSHLPKPLFPLGGKVPLAETWVRSLLSSGVRDISMNLCVLAQAMKRHFQDGTKLGAKIRYVVERVPTGTLGGVCKQALGGAASGPGDAESGLGVEEFTGKTLIVPSGDIVTDFKAEHLEEMYDIHKRAGAAFSMILVPVPWERRKDFGTVILDRPQTRRGAISESGRVHEFLEKDPNSPSNLNNASIYMIEMELLRQLDPLRTAAQSDVEEPFYDFGKHVFPALLGRLEHVSLPRDYVLWGLQYDGSWFDVGQKRDYLRVNEFLLDGRIDIALPYERLPWGFLGSNVEIDFSAVTIVPPVVIGNDCVIEGGATLGPYAVVGDGWVVQDGARVERSVLWERYPYFTETGREVTVDERRLVDRHEIRRGVAVEESILVGGTIESDIRHKTVDVLEDGRLAIQSIDYVPAGPRA